MITGKSIDDVLVNFSLFGPYYVQFISLIFMILLTNKMYWSNYVFVVEEVSYRCKDSGFGNDTCVKGNLTCSEWIYSNPHSFVAEFQLACQDWKRTLVGTMQIAGYMFGLFLIGPLSDRFGRKIVIVSTCFLSGVIGISRSFVPWYWMYCLLSFLECTIGDPYSPTLLLSLEMVAQKKRLMCQLLSVIGIPIGGIFLPLLAWLVPYWRNLLRVIYTPALFYIVYAYLLDESPRWLLSKQRKKEAIAIIMKTAKKNRSQLDQSVLNNLKNEKKDDDIRLSEQLKRTFTSSILLKRLTICQIWWICSNFVNTGMVITSVSLPGNKYVNFGLVSIMDLPAYAVSTYLLAKFNRKLPLLVCFIATALLCLGQPFVPEKWSWLAVIIYMGGKFLSTICDNIKFIYTCELFPTCTRNSMHAFCSFLGNAAGAVAPQTPLLMTYWRGLPAIAYGVSSLIAGLVTFFVPDSAGGPLPDTVKEAELVGMTPVISVG